MYLGCKGQVLNCLEQIRMTSSIQSWLWASSFTMMVFTTWIAGEPILGPDLNSCHTIIPKYDTREYTCCLLDRPIVDFKFPQGPMRVRQPLHKLNESFIAKYERAYAIMRSLPASDPRSHSAQADLHCLYTTGAYNQFNSSATLTVHGSWLVLPSHRWYVYFHERILGSLIGDDSFALPYWAWDIQYDPSANIIPYFYENPNSSLYDEFRSYLHMPPVTVDLLRPDHDRQEYFHEKDPLDKLRGNLNEMWRVMIGSAGTLDSFQGGQCSKGDEGGRPGQFEQGAHTAVHIWTGAQNMTGGEDMQPVYSSGRDPLFYNHHSQVDRLWQIYNDMGGKNYDAPDFLDSELLFYDENQNLVRVRMGDSLDLEKLRIAYEMIEPVDWMEYVPVSAKETETRRVRSDSLLRRSEVESPLISEEFPLQFRSSHVDGITTRVRRPLRGTTGGVVVRDETLVLEGTVTKPFDLGVAVHLFINLPEADQFTTRDCLEAVGSIYLDADGGRRITDGEVNTRKFSHKIGIGPRYKLLGIEDAASITVTLVPSWKIGFDSTVSIAFTHISLETQLD